MGGAGHVRCPQLGQATGSDQPRPSLERLNRSTPHLTSSSCFGITPRIQVMPDAGFGVSDRSMTPYSEQWLRRGMQKSNHERLLVGIFSITRRVEKTPTSYGTSAATLSIPCYFARNDQKKQGNTT